MKLGFGFFFDLGTGAKLKWNCTVGALGFNLNCIVYEVI